MHFLKGKEGGQSQTTENQHYNLIHLLLIRVDLNWSLTKQGDDAGQDSDESSGAETRWQHEGLSAARLGGPIRVTVTHSYRQSVSAAQGRGATVHDQHGQSIHSLLSSLKTTPLG